MTGKIIHPVQQTLDFFLEDSTPAVTRRSFSPVKEPPRIENNETSHFCLGEAVSLQELRENCRGCRRCDLRATCQQVVFGEGNEQAKIMFVGEGPGEQEDKQGRPFVGPAGQLLDKILQAAGFSREEVYIANVVKCRPPGNRLPNPQEIKACLPYLEQQIRLIRPAFVVCLGAVAAQALIDPKIRITQARGHWFMKDGMRVLPTFHPAALLRDETKKRPVWEDFKQLRKAYDETLSG